LPDLKIIAQMSLCCSLSILSLLLFVLPVWGKELQSRFIGVFCMELCYSFWGFLHRGCQDPGLVLWCISVAQPTDLVTEGTAGTGAVPLQVHNLLYHPFFFSIYHLCWWQGCSAPRKWVRDIWLELGHMVNIVDSSRPWFSEFDLERNV